MGAVVLQACGNGQGCQQWPPEQQSQDQDFVEGKRCESEGGTLIMIRVVVRQALWEKHLQNAASLDEALRRLSVVVDRAASSSAGGSRS